MKYKIIGIVAFLVVIIVSLLAPVLFDVNKEQRYQQHEEAVLGPEDEVADGSFSTHLPLVIIDTGGETIPGYGVKKADGDYKRDQYGHIAWSLADDGQSTIGGHMNVIDNEDIVNRKADTPTLSTDIRIRIRGNSSRLFAKKSYYIRLTEGTEDNDQPLLGMDSHSEWALYGPYLDKTLIRNYMWYNIAGQIMDYAPNVRFCEVILDGKYQGLYVMTETITAGKVNGGRLDLKVSKKNDSFSGYLLRLDRSEGDSLRNADTLTQYTLKTGNELDIIYPGTKNLTPAIAEGIRKDFSAFEKATYSYDFDSKKYGYEKYIDVNSFADYFIINELTCNYDAGNYSTYICKGIDGKLHMIVWDFNNVCDNYQEQPIGYYGFRLQEAPWYFMFMKDESFVQNIIDRYRYMRKDILSDEYLESYIDDVIQYLGPAIDRNYEVWGKAFEDDDLLYPKKRNLKSYDEAVNQLKTFLKQRTAWMDENIDALMQYAAESKNKKFTENSN